MSSIVAQPSTQGTFLSTPDAPRSSLFTCLACHVAFKTADIQREHYRSDWHRYNLKRKMVELPPVSADMFAQKVTGKSRNRLSLSKSVYDHPPLSLNTLLVQHE
jgi:pre-60S factor REI1